MKIFAKERSLTPSWDLVGPSVDLLKQNFQQLLYLSILPNAVLILGSLLLQTEAHKVVTSRDIIGNILVIFGGLWALLAAPGSLLFLSRRAQGKEIDLKTAFIGGLKRFFPFILASILSAISIMAGLIVLIIPGLILMRSFFLVTYYVVDQNLGPIQAMKKCAAESKPVSAWIWGTIGVTVVFSLASGFIRVIPYIGIIIGIVVSYLYIFGPVLRYCQVARLKTVKLD